MYAQVEKPKESKSRVVTNSVAQKKNSVKQGFGFMVNRTETIVQRKYKINEHNKIQDQILKIMSEASYVSRITSNDEFAAITKNNGIIPSSNKKGGFDEAKKWVTMGSDPQLEHTAKGQAFVTRFYLGNKLLDWATTNEIPIYDETESEMIGETDQARDKYEMFTVKSNGSEIGNLGIGAKLIPSFNSTMISKIEPVVPKGKKK